MSRVEPYGNKKDDLTGVQIAKLLQDHLQKMSLQSPPESIHALDLTRLQSDDITFWSVWEGNELLGCGALKEIDDQHGEIKSMKTSPLHLRKGTAKRLLIHIIDEAKKRGYNRLSLETGSIEAFLPARKLYECMGFQYTHPFADYIADPNSVFMTIKW